jgi:hypothetical protein
MSSILRKNRLVKVFAVSSRLAQAARCAAKRNRTLARCAAIHELRDAVGFTAVSKRVPALNTVVLSHADDNPDVLRDSRIESLVARAFHLLFAGPTTHPEQIAHWMNRTNVRSEQRLHVVQFKDLEAPQVSDLLGRVCSSLAGQDNGENIIDAYLSGEVLTVRGSDQRIIHIPAAMVPSLRKLCPAVLQDFRIDPDGSFIHWPVPDIHLGWNQFLQAVDPVALHRAQQRSADYNRRYGSAIRQLREKAGIRQALVSGITERQLRRIEQGQCRATRNALGALASTHGLEVNDYLERLSKEMSEANTGNMPSS